MLPIGGVKEKLLAAHRIGITTIILPRENEKDLADIPQNVLEVMTVELVENVDEVFRIALVPPAPPAPQEAGSRSRRPGRGRDDALTRMALPSLGAPLLAFIMAIHDKPNDDL